MALIAQLNQITWSITSVEVDFSHTQYSEPEGFCQHSYFCNQGFGKCTHLDNECSLFKFLQPSCSPCGRYFCAQHCLNSPRKAV